MSEDAQDVVLIVEDEPVILMLLLFVPEFTFKQFARLIRDFTQPLLQGLAALAVEVRVGRLFGAVLQFP